jgi:hypothetical protein
MTDEEAEKQFDRIMKEQRECTRRYNEQKKLRG